MASSSSQSVFHLFRVIGLFCDDVPFDLQKRGNKYYLASSLHDTFQIYDCDKLNVFQVGGKHESDVRAIVTYKSLTYTAANCEIYKWKRAKLVCKLSTHHHTPISSLLLFGEHLISASSQDNLVSIWSLRSDELFDSFRLENCSGITTVTHPSTYLNKILFGTLMGSLQLWNVKSKRCIHIFQGWGSEVTCVCQSPVVDIVAIGLRDGRIILHNLLLDKTLFSFKQVPGPASTLTFCTDGKFNCLVSGGGDSSLAVWNLDRRSLSTHMRGVHGGTVVKAQFFEKEPIMVTSGTDNTIKMWIFDQVGNTARVLKYRSGHSLPPTRIDFFNSSTALLSGSMDKSFRYFSTIRDQRSKEFSQGHLESMVKKRKGVLSTSSLKLSPIVHFCFCLPRKRQWDSIVSCHRDLTYAVTWNRENCTIGKHLLHNTEDVSRIVTAVCMSSCGNYAVIGSESGFIEKYNIQSGIHRGTYPKSSCLGERHTKMITGLVVDILNQYLISSSVDCELKFWDFEDSSLAASIKFDCPVVGLELCAESFILAVSCDDFSILIYDIDTKACVRRFNGHSAPITDLAFSRDARWLVSSSSDSTIRVWDLPTGQCVNWLKTKSPVLSLSLSPRGDFLATSHSDSRGIWLWANKNYFSETFLQPVTSSKPIHIEVPQAEIGIEDVPNESFDEMSVDSTNTHTEEDESSHDLFKGLTRYSSYKSSKWKTLVNLDLIAERNKLKTVLEPPKSAPFLLPTLPGLKAKFVEEPSQEQSKPSDTRSANSRFNKFNFENLSTPFVSLLNKCLLSEPSPDTSIFLDAVEMIASMTPSAIDFEIKSLRTDSQFSDFKAVLMFILDQLERGENYEIIQSLLNVFLKCHVSTLAEAAIVDPIIEKLLFSIQSAHRREWNKLQSLFHSNLCLITLFSNIQL